MKTKLKEKITLRPRGRKVDFEILKSLESLLGVTTYRRDHLIEYLHKIQDSNGAITKDYMTALSSLMGISQTEVYEVATFYTIYNLTPVGKHFIQVCTTTPCLIRGADKIVKLCKEKIAPNENEISKKVNKSASTISVSLKNLQRNNIIERVIMNKSSKISSDIGFKILNGKQSAKNLVKYNL